MSSREQERDEELAEAIVMAVFPGIGDVDDIPLPDFDGLVSRACRYVKWRNGSTEEEELEERMMEVLRRR